jgi:hypothetical protein
MVNQINFLGIERRLSGLGGFALIYYLIDFIRVNPLNPPNLRSINNTLSNVIPYFLKY